MATATVEISQPHTLQTKFEVELPEELAATLEEWFRKAGDVGDINRFASEVLELPLVDYRMEAYLESLPPGEKESKPSKRNKLSAFQKEEIVDLLDLGECKIPEVAKRFGVGTSTIRRILDARAAETGVAVKRKPPLDAQQIQEILRLDRVEGVSAVEIAERFGRCPTRINQILRGNK